MKGIQLCQAYFFPVPIHPNLLQISPNPVCCAAYWHQQYQICREGVEMEQSINSRVLQFRLVHFPSWKRALSACTGRCCSHTFDNWMFCPFFWQKFYVWWKSLLMACETYISSPACDLERLLSFYCLSQWLDRTAVSLLSPGVTDSYMLVKLGWAL